MENLFYTTTTEPNCNVVDYVMKSEENSITYFMNYLDKLGYTNVTNLNIASKKGSFSSADIGCRDKYNNPIIFELKRRYFESTRFGDLMMESFKVQNQLIEYPNCKRYLVNFFTDRWGFSEIKDENSEIKNMYARWGTETEFEYKNNTVKNKEFYLIKNNITYLDYGIY